MIEPIRLEFKDFVDLQTRLVLLPLVEEEGVGAVVAAYTPRNSDVERAIQEQCTRDVVRAHPLANDSPENGNAQENDEPSSPSCTSGIQMTQEIVVPSPLGADTDDHFENESDRPSKDTISSATVESMASANGNKEAWSDANESHANDMIDEKKEDASIKDAKTQSRVHENEPNSIPTDEEQVLQEHQLVGLVLTRINDSLGDLMGQDFTAILSTIRGSPCPIVLLFESPSSNGSVDGERMATQQSEESAEDDASTISSTTLHDSDEDEKIAFSTPRSMLGGRLSSWGSRVRATSAVLAAEAASGAASLSSAMVIAATEATERAKSNRPPEKRLTGNDSFASAQARDEKCSLFLQASSGKFLSLGAPGSPVPANAPLIKITTSSVVLVRQSEQQACPPRGYHFQWYRSYKTHTSDGSVSESSSKGGSDDGERSGVITLWTILPGAVHAAYQPSATDVGHRLRCDVTIVSDGPDEPHEKLVACESSEVVSADMSLFNAARQALVRGAQFGNIEGRGKAEGRIFRLNVEISRSLNSVTKSLDVMSALSIYQVSGNTAERMHEQPIFGASALSDPSHPKAFELVFPLGSSSMVEALSTDGRFQLQAHNRITRETLLLALGIANFKGMPANLDVTTVLYPGTPVVCKIEGEAQGANDTPKRSGKPDEVEFFTPQEGAPPTMAELERELEEMRSKLARKDKVVSDLHRQLTESEKQLRTTEGSLESCQGELEARRGECRDCRSSLRLADKRIETHESTLQRVKADHTLHITSLENRLMSQSEKIAELEKNVRSLKNERAVLSAGLEARDSKLLKMAELQKAVDSLSGKVSMGEAVRSELNEMSHRYSEISHDLEKVSQFEKECREELQQTRSTMDDLNRLLAKEQQKYSVCQSQLESLQGQVQQLKADRNSYKQKADSLSKEISRICRNGRTLQDIERIMTNEEAREMEVSILIAQKRQALVDLNHYRVAYEQSLQVRQRSGIKNEVVRALEQKSELERMLSDMTEYVNAKEMQMETLKQVNQTLTEELRMLAKASMNKNEI